MEVVGYSKDSYYINTILDCNYRRERVVSMFKFYAIWAWWILAKPHYRKFKGLNVLYEEDCPKNEF